MSNGESQSRITSLIAKQDAIGAIIASMVHQAEFSLAPVFAETFLAATRVLGASQAVLHVIDQREQSLELAYQLGLDSARIRGWRAVKARGRSPMALAFTRGRLVEFEGERAPKGLKALVASPVKEGSVTVGTLCLLWDRGRDYAPDPDRDTFLELLGSLLGLAMEHSGLVAQLVDNLHELTRLKEEEERRGEELKALNTKLRKANQRLEALSVTDGLTGLFNHRHLQERLAREVRRCRRYSHPLCLIMADLDHFKRVNDNLGHQAGDEGLKLFAGLLRDGVREVDMAGRYGGEEFVVVLGECSLEDGAAVAEKLRKEFEVMSRVEPFAGLGGLTVSMGVAGLKEGMTPGELIEAADQAMYRAKSRGRNRVETAD